MTSKAICCGERAVVVSVYVEKPRSSNSFKPHSRSSYHDGRRQHGRLDGGPNRRANLLRYCQNLRETASVESAALIPSRHSSSDDAATTTKMKTMKTTQPRLPSHLSSVDPPVPTPAKEHATKVKNPFLNVTLPYPSRTLTSLNQTIPAGARQQHSKTPACLGELGELIPRFMKSLTGLNRRKEREKKKKQQLKKPQHGTASSKMSAIIKSFDVQKKLGFFKKLLTALHNSR